MKIDWFHLLDINLKIILVLANHRLSKRPGGINPDFHNAKQSFDLSFYIPLALSTWTYCFILAFHPYSFYWIPEMCKYLLKLNPKKKTCFQTKFYLAASWWQMAPLFIVQSLNILYFHLLFKGLILNLFLVRYRQSVKNRSIKLS